MHQLFFDFIKANLGAIKDNFGAIKANFGAVADCADFHSMDLLDILVRSNDLVATTDESKSLI